jgi:hypothetical protein
MCQCAHTSFFILTPFPLYTMNKSYYLRNILIIIFSAFSLYLHAQQIYYVNPSSSGNQSGSSWTNAFADLNAALLVADRGDQIWMTGGTYHPTQDTDRSKSFEVRSGVQIFGGFLGTETNIDQRDSMASPTILSGDIGVPDEISDNSYNVVVYEKIDTTTILDGLIIDGGVANAPNPPTLRGNNGAAILAIVDSLEGTIVLKRVTIRDNYTLDRGTVYIGTANNYQSQLDILIEDCKFEDNTANRFAGALYIVGLARPDGWIKINRTNIVGNRSNFLYGGIKIESNRISILNCDFSKNFANNIYGAACLSSFSWGNSEFVIKKSVFYNNYAGNFSGISIGDILSNDSNIEFATIDSCLFKKNSGNTSSVNGISFRSFHAVLHKINNNVIDSCDFGAFDIISSGGKLEFSNNLIKEQKFNSYFDGNSNKIITGNKFINCKGVYFYNYQLLPPVTRDTTIYYVSDNLFYNSFFDIAAMTAFRWGTHYNNIFANNTFDASFCLNCNENRQTIYKNNIFWNNRDTLENQYVTWKLPIHNIEANFSNNIFDFLPTDSLPDKWVFGSGNIYMQEPMFIDTAALDFRLQPCSPAIQAGDSTGVTTTLDLLGRPRIVDGIIDIGAIEADPFVLDTDPVITPACIGATGSVSFSPIGCPPYTYTDPAGTPQPTTNLTAGTQTYIVRDARGRSITVPVTIPGGTPSVEAVVTPASDSLVSDGRIELANLSGNGPVDILWEDGSTQPQRTGLEHGIYVLTLNDVNGCVQVYVFTVGVVSGTNEAGLTALLKGPNPTSTYYRLMLSEPVTGRVRVFDTAGRQLSQLDLDYAQSDIQVDVNELPVGVYQLRIETSNGGYSTQFVKM